MTLIEFPGNRGEVFAVDPARVTAVAPYAGSLAGRTGTHEMAIVWLDNRSLFVCAWPLEHTLSVLNAARQPLVTAFEAGWKAFAAGFEGEADGPRRVADAYAQWIGGTP